MGNRSHFTRICAAAQNSFGGEKTAENAHKVRENLLEEDRLSTVEKFHSGTSLHPTPSGK